MVTLHPIPGTPTRVCVGRLSGYTAPYPWSPHTYCACVGRLSGYTAPYPWSPPYLLCLCRLTECPHRPDSAGIFREVLPSAYSSTKPMSQLGGSLSRWRRGCGQLVTRSNRGIMLKGLDVHVCMCVCVWYCNNFL